MKEEYKHLWFPAVGIFVGIFLTFMIGLGLDLPVVTIIGVITLVSCSLFLAINWNHYYKYVPDGSEFLIEQQKNGDVK